jgi:hypothetical protein
LNTCVGIWDLAALGFTHSQFAASGQPAFDRRVAQALL